MSRRGGSVSDVARKVGFATVYSWRLRRTPEASERKPHYALVPYEGQGYMNRGLRAVITDAFVTHGLHRLEANIQPDNLRSIGLVKSLGFRNEGYSPRYLKIAGRWRDHERWAITREEWRRIH